MFFTADNRGHSPLKQAVMTASTKPEILNTFITSFQNATNIRFSIEDSEKFYDLYEDVIAFMTRQKMSRLRIKLELSVRYMSLLLRLDCYSLPKSREQLRKQVGRMYCRPPASSEGAFGPMEWRCVRPGLPWSDTELKLIHARFHLLFESSVEAVEWYFNSFKPHLHPTLSTFRHLKLRLYKNNILYIDEVNDLFFFEGLWNGVQPLFTCINACVNTKEYFYDEHKLKDVAGLFDPRRSADKVPMLEFLMNQSQILQDVHPYLPDLYLVIEGQHNAVLRWMINNHLLTLNTTFPLDVPSSLPNCSICDRYYYCSVELMCGHVVCRACLPDLPTEYDGICDSVFCETCSENVSETILIPGDTIDIFRQHLEKQVCWLVNLLRANKNPCEVGHALLFLAAGEGKLVPMITLIEDGGIDAEVSVSINLYKIYIYNLYIYNICFLYLFYNGVNVELCSWGIEHYAHCC